MSAYATLLYEVEGPVCRITLDRPEKFNAINREMAAELEHAFLEQQKRANVASDEKR